MKRTRLSYWLWADARRRKVRNLRAGKRLLQHAPAGSLLERRNTKGTLLMEWVRK